MFRAFIEGEDYNKCTLSTVVNLLIAFQIWKAVVMVGNDYFEVIVKNDENSKGGRPAMDYEISVDMAKQICMIQRSEKGRQYRQYFIDLGKC